MAGVNEALQQADVVCAGHRDPLQRVFTGVETVEVERILSERAGDGVAARGQVVDGEGEQLVALVGVLVVNSVARDGVLDGHRDLVVAGVVVPQLAAVLDGDGAVGMGDLTDVVGVADDTGWDDRGGFDGDVVVYRRHTDRTPVVGHVPSAVGDEPLVSHGEVGREGVGGSDVLDGVGVAAGDHVAVLRPVEERKVVAGGRGGELDVLAVGIVARVAVGGRDGEPDVGTLLQVGHRGCSP